MPHALPRLVAEAGCDQLVVAPHRAIEEDHGRTGKPRFQFIGNAGAGGQEIEISARCLVADPKSERIAGAVVSAGMSLTFEIPCAFARNGARQHLDAGWQAVGPRRLAGPVPPSS